MNWNALGYKERDHRRVELGENAYATIQGKTWEDGEDSCRIKIFEDGRCIDGLELEFMDALCFIMSYHPIVTTKQMASTLRSVRRNRGKIVQIILPVGLLNDLVTLRTTFGMIGIESDGHSHM